MHKQLAEAALAVLAPIQQEHDAIRQRTQQKIHVCYQQHVEQLTIAFEPPVERRLIVLGEHIGQVLAVACSYSIQYNGGANAHDHAWQERIHDYVYPNKVFA